MTTEKRLKNYEEYLTGGFEHNVLHRLEHEENGTEIVMFTMDVEYDPVRITYGGDGEASIHADNHKWHMFSPEQLEFIAEKGREAADMWDKIFDEIDEGSVQ